MGHFRTGQVCDGGGGGTHQVAERKSKQTKETKELT